MDERSQQSRGRRGSEDIAANGGDSDVRASRRDPGADDERRPMDPTRKLLKVFGVKVTDYEAKTEALLAARVGGEPADMSVVREIVELTADLDRWLREIQGHVLERQERVLSRLFGETTDD